MTDPVDTDALRAEWRELYEDDYEEHVSGCRYLHNNHSYFAGRAYAADEVDRLRRDVRFHQQHAVQRAAAYEKLRGVVEAAPHERPCMLEIPEARRDRTVPWDCTCWKADAL